MFSRNQGTDRDRTEQCLESFFTKLTFSGKSCQVAEVLRNRAVGRGNWDCYLCWRAKEGLSGKWHLSRDLRKERGMPFWRGIVGQALISISTL